jgi:hypothetical protein
MTDRRGQQGREGAKAGSGNGTRWTRAKAEEELAQWSASGESLYSYARRHGLSEQRLYYWRARLADDPEPARARLVPAVIRGAAPGWVNLEVGRACSAVTVSYGEVRIEVSDPCAVDAGWVSDLVRSLVGSER